jgi:hypothetical protein
MKKQAKSFERIFKLASKIPLKVRKSIIKLNKLKKM